MWSSSSSTHDEYQTWTIIIIFNITYCHCLYCCLEMMVIVVYVLECTLLVIDLIDLFIIIYFFMNKKWSELGCRRMDGLIWVYTSSQFVERIGSGYLLLIFLSLRSIFEKERKKKKKRKKEEQGGGRERGRRKRRRRKKNKNKNKKSTLVSTPLRLAR